VLFVLVSALHNRSRQGVCLSHSGLWNALNDTGFGVWIWWLGTHHQESSSLLLVVPPELMNESARWDLHSNAAFISEATKPYYAGWDILASLAGPAWEFQIS